MDAGQHNLPKPLPCKGTDAAEDFFEGDTSAPAAGVGNDAVGAVGIAAVLDLEKCPGMLGKALQSKGLSPLFGHNVRDQHLLLCTKPFQKRRDPLLFRIADN